MPIVIDGTKDVVPLLMYLVQLIPTFNSHAPSERPKRPVLQRKLVRKDLVDPEVE